MIKFKGNLISKLVSWILLAFFMSWTIVPIYIIVSNSFRQTLDMRKMPPDLIFKPTFEHYANAFTRGDFLLYFRNSFVIAAATTLISILCGTMTAYALIIIKSKWGERISNMMLLGKLVPSITILIPLYVMLNRMNIIGTYIGPVLAHTAFNLPFVAWLMLGFMRELPKHLLEAAKLDGCTRMKTFWKVFCPLLSPALCSAILLVMQNSWNELLFSLQLTNLDTYTLTVGISRFVGSISVHWGQSSAAATVTMVPIILVGFFMQKYLVRGLTAGSVKG